MRHARVAEDFVEASCVERVPVMDEKSLSSQEATQVDEQVDWPLGRRPAEPDLT